MANSVDSDQTAPTLFAPAVSPNVENVNTCIDLTRSVETCISRLTCN